MIGEIIIGVILAVIAMGLYGYKLHKISYADYARALNRHYKAAEFILTAKLAREVLFLGLAVLLVALISFLLDGTQSHGWFYHLTKSVYHKIIQPYTLFTSIAGAFIALFLNYFFVHPKAYLHPDAMYEMEGDGHRHLKFFVENQSLFDCTNVRIDAYKSVKINDSETFIEPLQFRVKEIASLSGIMSNFNDKTIVFTIDKLKETDLTDPQFGDIEVCVSLTHSLSNVTKSITRHYGIEDMYCVTNEKNVMKVDLPKYEDNKIYLHTLKEGSSRRFISARRVVYVFLALLLMLVGIYLCDFKIVGSHLQYLTAAIYVVAYTILVFSIIRFIFHFEIKTDPQDENADYRMVNNQIIA